MKFYHYLFLIVLVACKKEVTQPPFEATPYTFPQISNFRPFINDPENPLTEEGVKLGHQLFFEKRLSKDFTLSCASCHLPEHGFSDPNAVSIGVDGKTGRRQAMSLLNLAWSDQFFWDGRAKTLREQALSPIPDSVEMHLEWSVAEQRLQAIPAYVDLFKNAFNSEKITSTLITKAIEQYVKTLVVYQSDYDLHVRGVKKMSESAQRGLAIFNSEKGDCFHCHTTPELLVHPSTLFMNNGLDLVDDPNGFADKGLGEFTQKREDKGKFKIPSLRNVAMTAPYMHDGRFKTLEEVIDFYNEGPKMSPSLEPIMIAEANRRVLQFGRWGLGLTPEEKSDLLDFLNALTDKTYLNNPHYQAPAPLN